MIQVIQLADSLGEAILLGTAFLAAIYIAIVCHEVAHGYVALLNGDDTAKYMGRLTANPVKHFNAVGFLMLVFVGFGFAKPVPIDPSKFRNFKKGLIWVSLAGVLTNLVIAFILFPFQNLVSSVNLYGISAFWVGVLEWVYYFLYFAIMININLAAFNLLPIAPLDGFNLISAFVNPQNQFMTFLRRYSIMILLILVMWEYIPILDTFSPLSLYIGYCNIGLRWVFGQFWGLFGL
ncbi:MAG TPA: site-2 protease family protein [Eubacteriales bacterium]|nr:site-2 protease family protein [Eubacteriales bacterium]